MATYRKQVGLVWGFVAHCGDVYPESKGLMLDLSTQSAVVLSLSCSSNLPLSTHSWNSTALRAAVHLLLLYFFICSIPNPHPQVQKIRLLLRQRGLGSIRVGTVDDYQGQEERIIFISTTLSKPESLPSVATAPQPPSAPTSGAALAASDAHESGGQEAGTDRNLGFWRNPKRFNVSREP
jgi:hypothetical protein